MATIDQQFVEYIVKTLVNNPDKVNIDRKIDEKGVLLSLSVDPEDVGRVIGRRGATAQSIRTLLRALGTKNDARYNLKIVNDGDDYSGNRASSRPEVAPVDPDIDVLATMDEVEREKEEEENIPLNLDRDEDELEDEDDGAALAEKTRAELADLDDLDI